MMLQLQTLSFSKRETVSLDDEKDTNIPSKPQSQAHQMALQYEHQALTNNYISHSSNRMKIFLTYS